MTRDWLLTVLLLAAPYLIAVLVAAILLLRTSITALARQTGSSGPADGAALSNAPLANEGQS